jgi:thiol-disulfide isomerase/thioredoxin
VLDYKKRIIWSDAILAWFDRWLKDEPEWWDAAYPPVDEPGKKRPGKLGIRDVEMEKYGTVLFGELSRGDVMGRLEEWEEDYEMYQPDTGVVADFKEALRGVRITCVLGTWCADSRREVPRLWKVLDEAGFPFSRLKMYAVASSRFTEETPVPREVLDWSKAVKSWYDVEAVATIIFSRGGKELGRIVEAPEGSIERDMADILER